MWDFTNRVRISWARLAAHFRFSLLPALAACNSTVLDLFSSLLNVIVLLARSGIYTMLAACGGEVGMFLESSICDRGDCRALETALGLARSSICGLCCKHRSM